MMAREIRADRKTVSSCHLHSIQTLEFSLGLRVVGEL